MTLLPRPGHRTRYRQIAEVLARHGLGFLVGVLGLERFLPFHRGWLGHPRRPQPYTRPEHLRMALEELGVTFTKLGQILSSRPDLFPPAYQQELAKLQDAASPVPWPDIEHTLASELGRPVSQLFASINPEPLAAASIGQAHAAVLHDGTEVVVKVRRPGAVEQVEEDLDILQRLSSVASRRWEVAEQYDVEGLAQEFSQTLRAELDYVREGRNVERFADNFAGDSRIHIPRVFWETSSSQVLTLERIKGIKVDDVEALEAAGIDRKALAVRTTGILLKMVFEDGYFHADPHPGNFFVEPGGRIGLIDFGMVGIVDQRTQEQLVQVLLALTSREPDRLVDAVLDLGLARRRVDRALLRQDLDHLVSRYYGQALADIELGPLVEDVLGVIRRHRLRLPPNLLLLSKTVMMAEGMGSRLDPDFQLANSLAPYARRLVLRQYSPWVWAKRMGRAGMDAAWLVSEFPVRARRLLSDLERGGVEVGMRPVGFEPVLARVERLVNRLIAGILGAALIIGVAVLLSVYNPGNWEPWAGALIILGFLGIVVVGGYLAWSIFRAGRR